MQEIDYEPSLSRFANHSRFTNHDHRNSFSVRDVSRRLHMPHDVNLLLSFLFYAYATCSKLRILVLASPAAIFEAIRSLVRSIQAIYLRLPGYTPVSDSRGRVPRGSPCYGGTLTEYYSGLHLPPPTPKYPGISPRCQSLVHDSTIQDDILDKCNLVTKGIGD